MLYLILQRLKGQLGHPLLPTRNILEHVTFTSRLYFINLRKHLIKGKRIVLVGCSSWWIELFGVMKLIYYSALQCETLLGLDVRSSKINEKKFGKIHQNVSSAKECDIFINFAIHCELVSVCPRQ